MDTLQPTLLFDEVRAAPSGNALTRGLRALFLERRLPYSVEMSIGRALKRLGMTDQTLRAGGYRVTCRRATLDEAIIDNVLVQEEYFRFDPSFRPTAGQTVIDIGANIGSFALVAAKYVGSTGRVISIEPHPENLHYLSRNIKQNDLRNVTIVPGAISSVPGSIQLFVSTVQSGLHSTRIDRGQGSVTVTAFTLAELMQQYSIERCDLLKIDCEGAEFDFLPSIEVATWRRIKRIAMEYSAPMRLAGLDVSERRATKHTLSAKLIEILQDQGFRIDGYYDCDGHLAGYIFATNLH